MEVAHRNEMTGSDLRYQQRFDAQQKAVDAALLAAEKAVATAMASADRAVVKAEAAAEKRFEAVNEFRATLADQSATLMPRPEADSHFKALSDKIDDVKARLDRREGGSDGVRIAQTEGHMTIGSVMSIVVGVIGALSLVVVAFGTMNSSHSVVPPAINPTVGADTKRVDDLIARFDALSTRMNAQLATPSQTK